MGNQILEYVLNLSTVVILPVAIWIMAVWRLARMRGFDSSNIEEKVNESVECTLKEQIIAKLSPLFNQQGVNQPTRSQLNDIVDRMVPEGYDITILNSLGEIYRSLVENGLQSPFFSQALEIWVNQFGG